jgi:hypothetical protein
VFFHFKNAQPRQSPEFFNIVVRSPGFEPGSSAWEAGVLAKLDYDRLKQSLNLANLFSVIHYFKHGLTAAFWGLLFMAVVRVCAVAPFIFSFNFLAACFALKRRHHRPKENINPDNNNFAR